MKKMSEHMTYANVVATLALFFTLTGGAAYAASHLAKNSVGTNQLKRSSVTSSKVKDGSITGSDLKLSSLGKVPFAARADSAARADDASRADVAADAGTLQGKPASAFVRGSAQVLSARRELQIGETAQLVAFPGIGEMTATCSMGKTNPKVLFTFTNRSGGTMDQALEFFGGIDAGTVPDGETSSSGGENIAALRMKLATRTSPATVVTFDLSMADDAPAPCGVYVQAIAST